MTETPETSNLTATVVLYDDACGMCLRTVARLRPLLELRGFLFEPFPKGAVKNEMIVIFPDGRRVEGADAMVAMARSVWWMGPITFPARLPGVMPLLRKGYRKIAANRHCIGKTCGWNPPATPA